ncbi:cell division protein ZapE [Phytoactinopolyspora halotolerans]|uniref:Cell division protein ZapE n=2 Tax=Phytoactinopolyspora halotolerans TaxID=1981512 RepID=A0A6L9SCD7_9ACTN|nr:cell division protein ZapE [Phytoactinopolyspora halotolerans]
MVPPPRFGQVSFDSYIPDPAQPSQRHAVATLDAFAQTVAPAQRGRRRWFGLRPGASAGGTADETRPGVYLDGGFGVGKTHLLASLWHAADVPAEQKTFCTFVELTNLVGALGFGSTVQALSERRLVCIDEFELDDPGDTVLISTLLTRLVEAGVKLAATSNTLPDKLGEGRFAAEDFLREIQALSARFAVLRIDGEDYRHRGLPDAPPPLSDDEVTRLADDGLGRVADGGHERLADERPSGTGTATLDDFDALCAHLATVHPSRYGPMLDGVSRVHLRGVRTIDDQNVALRLVVLADRLYDRDVPVVSSGVPLDRLFTDDLLKGGYRKKYFRAVSRLVALARDGGDTARP